MEKVSFELSKEELNKLEKKLYGTGKNEDLGMVSLGTSTFSNQFNIECPPGDYLEVSIYPKGLKKKNANNPLENTVYTGPKARLLVNRKGDPKIAYLSAKDKETLEGARLKMLEAVR